jgi:hypothetical protein
LSTSATLSWWLPCPPNLALPGAALSNSQWGVSLPPRKSQAATTDRA